MDTKPGKSSSGILRSIRKLIFEDADHEQHQPLTSTEAPSPKKETEPVLKTAEPVYVKPAPTGNAEAGDLKEMKGRVLDLLEKLNEEGLDFFEVWNAAAEMGSVDATSIKAAFTSLKYVDKSLTKEKLLNSARNYATRIQGVIDQDVAQKQNHKQAVQNNLVNEKQLLEKEIEGLETQIKELQHKLLGRQQFYKELDGKYESQLKEMDEKIAIGKAAVKEVVNDIEKAISIIEQNIN